MTVSRAPFLIAFLLGTGAAASATVRADIERQYRRWVHATLANDVDTILAVLAPNYTLRTYAGTVVPLVDYEKSLRKRKALKSKADAYQTAIFSMEVKGPQAFVISDETSSKLSFDPITQKRLKMIHTHRYLDTWQKMGRTWRLFSTVTKAETTKVVPL